MIQEPVLSSNGKTDEMIRCQRTGVIESSDIQRKRVALLQRNNIRLKLLGMTVSKPDKTWEIITYPEADDGNYVAIGFDDSGVYQADIMDKLALFNKTFLYNGSDLQKLGETIIKLNSTLIGVNRLVLNSFCNWLLDFKAEDLNRNYILTNIDNTVTYLNVKSVIFDIECGWEGANYLGLRRVEFYDLSNNKISLTSSDFTAYATTQYTTYLPRYAFETALSKIGTEINTCWICVNGTYTKQRLICVFNTPKDISKIVINNYHHNGTYPVRGAKSTIIRVSSDAITSTVWGSAITNGKIIFGGDIPQHAATDTVQDWVIPNQHIPTSMGTGVKSIILDIKNTHGATNYVGIRRVELYTPEGVLIPLTTSDMICYATTYYDSNATYAPRHTFTTALSKIGAWENTQWLSGGAYSSNYTNQRLICVLNTPRDIGFIVINNAHSSGGYGANGAKETKIYISTDAITLPHYNAPVSNSTLIFFGDLPAHSNNNTIENILISLQEGFRLTTSSNQEVDLSLLPLGKGTNIKTIDGKTFVVSEIVNNKIIPTKLPSISYSMGVSNIESLPLSSEISYNKLSNPITVISNSKLPLLRGDTINSISVIESPLEETSIESAINKDFADLFHLYIASDTVNGSTVFVDKSPYKRPLTAVGGVTNSTIRSKFRTSSIMQSGNGSYISCDNSDRFFTFYKSHFTIDFWVYCTTYSTSYQYCIALSNGGNEIRFEYAQLQVDYNKIRVPAPPLNQWNHIALIRDSVGLKLYVNGILGGAYNDVNYTWGYNEYNFLIGTTSTYPLLGGSIDEIRVTKNVVWSGNFTPPKRPYDYVPAVGEEIAYRLTPNANIITGTLTNFPITIVLSSSNISDYYLNLIFSGVYTNIRIEDETGTNLSTEVELWDSVNKKVVLHSKVPSFTSTSQIFVKIVSNNDMIGLTGSVEAQAVWDSNFKAVYTMSQDPSVGGACILDSTINANHGTPMGSMTNSDLINGGISKAIDFDGVNDYIEIPDSNSFNIANGVLTIEALVKTSDTLGEIISHFNPTSPYAGWSIGAGITVSDGTFRAHLGNGSTSNSGYTSYFQISTSYYLHVVLQITGNTTCQFYVSGVPVGSSFTCYTPADSNNVVRIGAETNSTILRYLSGQIEHIRITNTTARSNAWIKATNHSLKDDLFIYTGVYDAPPLVSNARLYYSLSFDNKRTYKVWKNDAWRAIASNLDSVHGVSGDSNWYYRDDADVWSRVGVDNSITALDKATSYPNNQMEKTALEGLTDTEFNITGGFVQSNGYFDIALSFVSLEGNTGLTVKNLVINDNTKQVWELAPINIGVTSSAIGSSIRWEYNVDATYDFESKVKVYAMVSDKTGYSLCTNGSAIPQINVGDDLTGKQLFIKVVYDTLALPVTVDPAASIAFNITVS